MGNKKSLRKENKRMRRRIETLRGALKYVSGRVYEFFEYRLGDYCMEIAGDMEPPICDKNTGKKKGSV